MKVIQTISDLRTARAALGDDVGVVTTMGALHAGHMALVKQARFDNERVLVTIFVNPTQFGPDEDLGSYPRTLERDLQLLETAGVDVVFTPTPELMYPDGYQTYVDVENVSQRLEGIHRDGHFRGVATVVSKLFNMTQPARAYFGQKDAQQVVVIRRMVRDLNFPVDVIVVPTIREDDGLAMSSRNAYLSPQEREAATVLYRSLQAAATLYDNSERHPEKLRQAMWAALNSEPLATVDYVSAADVLTLDELQSPTDAPILLSLTVQIGKPRLLDNLLLPAHLNTVTGLTATLGAE
ncbi:MAG: pantoate--beta-alanine ligase [Chloroflexota bacterium]